MLPEKDLENLNNERIEEENAMDADSYIEALKKMKETTVSKDEYDRLKIENRKLLNSLANGEYQEQSKQEEKIPTREECYKAYRKNDFKSDLDYWKNMCELRKATINEYGLDPTVTGSYGVTPTGERLESEYGEAEAMENQFEIIESIIEASEGNPRTFDILMADAIRK